MSEWTPELQTAFRRFKSTLTRRTNCKDWCGVIRLWTEFQQFYDSRNAPWPDDWRRFERAAEDASLQIRLNTFERSKGVTW